MSEKKKRELEVLIVALGSVSCCLKLSSAWLWSSQSSLTECVWGVFGFLLPIHSPTHIQLSFYAATLFPSWVENLKYRFSQSFFSSVCIIDWNLCSGVFSNLFPLKETPLRCIKEINWQCLCSDRVLICLCMPPLITIFISVIGLLGGQEVLH